MAQVIDYDALYRIGRTATGPTPRRQPSKLETAVFNFVGNQALNYWNSAWDKKKKIAAKQEAFDDDQMTTVSQSSDYMKELYGKSIDIWHKERNKGQNLVAKYHGFPGSKKYKEGMSLINGAQSKLETLHRDATDRLRRISEGKGMNKFNMIMGEDGKPIKTKYSSGTTGEEMDHLNSLINGDLDQSTVVNEKTGGLMTVSEVDNVMYSPEEVKEKGISPTLEYTPWAEQKWPRYEDNTAQNMSGKYKDSAISYGNSGLEWDEEHEMGVRADITQDINELEPEAFEDWFFGGTQYKYSDAGKNFMTPAQDFIAQNYGYSPGTAEYEGVLTSLKRQDLNSPEYKQFAINSMVDVSKQYHLNALDAYKEKHKEKPKQYKPEKQDQRLVDGGKVAYVDAKRMAGEMYGGAGTWYGGDGIKYVQDGKGNTQIWEQDRETVTTKNEFGETVNVSRGTGKYKLSETTTTEDAVNRRGLSGFYNNPYTKATTTEEKATQTYVPKAASADDARLQKDLAYQLRQAFPNDPRNFKGASLKDLQKMWNDYTTQIKEDTKPKFNF